MHGSRATVVTVVMVAADQPAIGATHSELVAGNQSALARDAPETVDVVDAVARSHYEIDLVEAETAAGTLDTK